MDAKAAAQQHGQEANDDFNSSEYTHSNLDPAVNANEQQPSEASASTAQHDVAQSGAQDAAASDAAAVHNTSHTQAMEAVMQLAQAASQQQYDQQHSTSTTEELEHQHYGHVENPDVHHDALPVSNADDSNTAGSAEKRGNKRRPSMNATSPGGRGRRASKAARNDEHDVAAAAAAAAVVAATAENGGGEHLPFPESWSQGDIPAQIQKAYQQHLAEAQAQANLQSTASASPSTGHDDPSTSSTATTTAASGTFKPTRQLSTSKRAAQNRAAQRAFRERRDKYVKILESKAARLETAIRVATECKRRYAETLQTVDDLRQDNHTLRVALAALSGTSVEGQPPPTMVKEALLASLSQIPLLTTEEEEEGLAGVQVGRGAGAGASGGGEGGSGEGLDSLSAVAVAAAAADSGAGGEAKVGADASQTQQTATADDASKAASVALPQPPTTTATSPSAATAQ